MARERVYRNNAEKQAAYRARQAERAPAPQALLANVGQELHGRLRQAVEGGTNWIPAAVLGKRADDTLINLIGYVTRGEVPGKKKERPPRGERREAASEEGSRRGAGTVRNGGSQRSAQGTATVHGTVECTTR